ncbi:LacI family transcriptional regulator [Leucobacter zeae]|nr:LacI family transcriptional regulator [Leucobacter zeae]
MARKRATIVDIAAALGLSKTTVSDALHGRGRVAPATVVQVRSAAAELGYVGNRAAQQLRGSRVGAFGLHIPPVVRSFAFYMEFVFGAVSAAGELGVDLVHLTRDVDALAARPPSVDGVIAIDPLPGDPVLPVLRGLGVPLVTAGRQLDPSAPLAHGTIEVPYAERIGQLLDRAAAAGRRRPALLLPDQQFHSSFPEDVLAGYRDWCSAHDRAPVIRELPLHPSPAVLTAVLSEVLGSEPAAGSVRDDGIDVLLCGYQGLAGRLVGHLAAHGRTPGQRFELVSLVGDPVSEMLDERITCLDVRPREFGREAAHLLAELIDGSVAAPARRSHSAEIRPSAE